MKNKSGFDFDRIGKGKNNTLCSLGPEETGTHTLLIGQTGTTAI